MAFAPIQVVRVKDSADPECPDGAGSVRRRALGEVEAVTRASPYLSQTNALNIRLLKTHW